MNWPVGSVFGEGNTRFAYPRRGRRQYLPRFRAESFRVSGGLARGRRRYFPRFRAVSFRPRGGLARGRGEGRTLNIMGEGEVARRAGKKAR